MGLLLMVSTGVLAGDHAVSGELFEPQNAHLTQSTLTPESRSFVVVDDENAVIADDRLVRQASTTPPPAVLGRGGFQRIRFT